MFGFRRKLKRSRRKVLSRRIRRGVTALNLVKRDSRNNSWLTLSHCLEPSVSFVIINRAWVILVLLGSFLEVGFSGGQVVRLFVYHKSFEGSPR